MTCRGKCAWRRPGKQDVSVTQPLQYVLPALFAVGAWWGSTALLFFLNNLPRHSFRWSMLGATILAALSLHGLAATSGQATAAGAYLAFTAALLAWGWLQMSFYMGFITGPRLAPCHDGCKGWRHFGHAIVAGLYHELATLALAAAVVALTWHAPNRVGLWTFVLLWVMHLSAKLNVFLGVSNLNAEFLPPHMDFIRPFMKQKAMNPLFPLSISASTVIAVLLVQQVAAAGTDRMRVAGGVLVATLLVLAILEHWFLVLPLPAARSWNALWRWTLKGRDRRLSLPKIGWPTRDSWQAGMDGLSTPSGRRK
jgi:putative photosynthetic complex assembly protein 2